MEERIRDIITDALEKAKVKFDTDGKTIWVDDPETNKTFYVSIEECAQ